MERVNTKRYGIVQFLPAPPFRHCARARSPRSACLSRAPGTSSVVLRAALLPALGFVAFVAAGARAEVVGSVFRSSTWGVEMIVPRGWELSEQSSYPRILAGALEQRGSGRVLLSAQRLAAGDSARATADRSAAALKRIGYQLGAPTTHPTGAVLLEATTADRKRLVRQAYLERNGVAYVLSLACDAPDGARYLHPFDDILRNLRFSFPVAPGGT
jgi:hypothetical protein